MQATAPDQTWTYEQVAAKATLLRVAIQELGVRMHRESALAKLLREAEALARDWAAGRSEGGIEQVMRAADANRVADAIATAKHDPGALDCIRRMCSNSMDLSERNPSQGKDALWELDFASFLRRRRISVDHVEPPDLLADFGFGAYPIACKKVYSESGLESQVRKAAKQLERYGQPGLVAVNLDDLTPANAVLQSANLETAADFLARFNHSVLDRNQRRLERFIKDGRCDGILVSTTTPADFVDISPRFNTHSQVTLWSLASLPAEQTNRLSRIRDALGVLP